MYESISSRQSHIYEVIGSKPKVPPRTTPVQNTKSRPVPPPRGATNVNATAVVNFNTPHVLQPNVLKYFQQKLYESFGNNDPQPQRMLLEAVCGENRTAEVPLTNQNRIDMMLETAQFLATAAYLER